MSASMLILNLNKFSNRQPWDLHPRSHSNLQLRIRSRSTCQSALQIQVFREKDMDKGIGSGSQVMDLNQGLEWELDTNDFSNFHSDINIDQFELVDNMQFFPESESQQVIPQSHNESDIWPPEMFTASAMAFPSPSSMADQSQNLPLSNHVSDHVLNIDNHPNHVQYAWSMTPSQIPLDHSSSVAAEVENIVRVIKVRSNDEKSLDDGYKWMMYGRKILKRSGSPYPKSYYKCKEDGCRVKKYVERDASDAGVVTFTYHGRHNHVCPSIIY